MAISKRSFESLQDGTPVSNWLLTNEQGMQAEVLDYGVIIRSILVPDQKGQPVDVVLGYDTLEEYVSDTEYLGATVGRFANRIKNACFEQNGKTYALFANDGNNHLHGGKRGFNKYVWESRQEGNTVVFSVHHRMGKRAIPEISTSR
jgi:aldose 1-epimerase